MRQGAMVGGTLVAMILAPITVALVSIVVGLVAGLFYLAMTLIRPEIIGLFAACLGGGIGVAAARGACDAVLRGYAPRIICGELWLLCLAGAAYELAALPMAWARLAPIAQLVVVAVAAYHLFGSEDARRTAR